MRDGSTAVPATLADVVTDVVTIEAVGVPTPGSSPTPTERKLDRIVRECLAFDRQNATRMRALVRFFAEIVRLDEGVAYAVTVSKPGNLRKQLDQSKSARAAQLAVAVLEGDEYSASDYETVARALVTSDDHVCRTLIVVALHGGIWRVPLVVAASGAPEIGALGEVASRAVVVDAGLKPITETGRVMPMLAGTHAGAVSRPEDAPPLLDPRIRAELLTLHRSMTAAGELRTAEALESYADAFRARFGPEALAAVDGEDLAELMHNHANRDSLAYWIEFKSDEQFPALFGSIAGGSAFKFGVYKRKENGAWAVQGESRQPREISVAEAVDIARRHRQQLRDGLEVIAALDGDDPADYAALERRLHEVAPDVADTAWGHKYFHLFFPDRLDDFHVARYQRYHELRLLQSPTPGTGRYAPASTFVRVAASLGVPLKHLTALLIRRHGSPRRYWRIGTSDGVAPRNQWERMRRDGVVAIGWSALGDLGPLREIDGRREAIRRLLEEHYPNAATVQSRKAGEIDTFLGRIVEGDIVCASDGATVLGVGVVRGPYRFHGGHEFPHSRDVEWLALHEWRLEPAEGLRTTVSELDTATSLLSVERALLKNTSPVVGAPLLLRERASAAYASTPARPLSSVVTTLAGTPRRIADILDRKGQVILYGPPGTGKTHHAIRAARDIVARQVFERAYAELADDERAVIDGDGRRAGLVRTVTFHPEAGYEGFIEGYHPVVRDERLLYELRDGIFKQLCHEATRNPSGRAHILIVDEINRGDVPRIFGELLTLLERDKRGHPVRLPVSGAAFSVPRNVYVIGTMNTADRSIALLDTALRRRFGFVALMPDYTALGKGSIDGLPLAAWLRWLNARVRQVVGSDGRHREIGHGYLWHNGAPVATASDFARIVRDDIVPLLEEYCFDDVAQLEAVLGDAIVDVEQQRVRYELFDDDPTTVIAALLAAAPELGTGDAGEADAPDGAGPMDDDGDVDAPG